MKARSNVGRLERELGALRETIGQTESARDGQAQLAEQAAAERREVAHDPAAFGGAAAKAAQHRDEAHRLGFVLDSHAKDLARLERELEHARYQDAMQALETVAKRRHDAARHLTTALAAGIEALPALETARDEFDAARAQARELCPEDVEFELPKNADEPEWPDGVDRLLELVGAGSRRPLASTAAAIGKARAEREKGEASKIAPAVTEALELGLFDRIRALPPGRLPDALAFAERRRDLEVARLTKSVSEAPHAGASERTTEVVDAINRRVEKIRALVSETEQAAA